MFILRRDLGDGVQSTADVDEIAWQSHACQGFAVEHMFTVLTED